MRLALLKYKTRSLLKSNKALRTSLPYKQALSIGIVFTVEDKQKHDDIKDFVRRLEHDGKQVRVMTFLPKNKDNYDFLFDFYTEKDISFWGSLTSESANRFCDHPFDFLFYLDNTPNPLVLNLVAKSNARCRVGKYWSEAEPFFELMVQVQNGTRSLIDSIYRYTSKLK